MGRLTEKDFLGKKGGTIVVNIILCEIFAGDEGAGRGEGKGQTKIARYGKRTAMLRWDENCNYAGEPGIRLDDGGYGYAGYDEKTKIYLRYNGCLEANEHGFMIDETKHRKFGPADFEKSPQIQATIVFVDISENGIEESDPQDIRIGWMDGEGYMKKSSIIIWNPTIREWFPGFDETTGIYLLEDAPLKDNIRGFKIVTSRRLHHPNI